MSDFTNLLAEISNNTLIITINRPDKLNALNQTTLKELRQAVLMGMEENEVYGMIITGAGDKAFVAGADISEFKGFGIEEGKLLAANGHEIFNLIERSPKPILAAINGFALGGGCELSMACHLRVASENARFGQPEVNLGIIPGYGGTQRLIQLIGKTKATELLLTADMIKAPEALQLGLLNYVVPADELLTKASEILQKIYSKGPKSIQKVIQCVNAYYDKGTDGMEFEIEAFASCCGTSEFVEGTDAFLEKRKAAFRKTNVQA